MFSVFEWSVYGSPLYIRKESNISLKMILTKKLGQPARLFLAVLFSDIDRA